jgi:serine/threonine protein kinase
MSQRIGQQVGVYRLLRVLGEGGFATVYLGEHLHLGTLAALKLLHLSFSSEGVEAFRREALLIARLDHPHIVRVLDYDVQAGMPFLVMSFAPGGTLRQLYPRGSRLGLSTVLDYVSQVASALQYAHDQHIIHRDLKPENLLLGRNKEILLSDFGIALLSQSSLHQGTQDVVGTAAYMAPEQFKGKPGKASDQYALAVIVYEWLTGERPFSGSFVELASQHLYAAPPPIQGKAAVSPVVELVVLTALAKDPTQRFGSVREFATALEQAAHTLSPTIPAHARPPVDHGTSMVTAPTIPPTAPESASLSAGLARPSQQQQAAGPGAREPAQRRRARRTRRVRAICFVLFVASVLLWLITAADPALHEWFAGAILLTLVFWIAAYADHRRATEGFRAKQAFPGRRKELS